ncbi:nucleoside hydrolase 3-like isoform X2 [Alnus glutinosa]|uniref:nucleoside hydrolase 3-like isoform X2 n=1 Tax=Alnus glutinosa TaxID=3517 RepID=UPI002D781230|nr:nucleoside hydrolase 3-like isoform X2 [Alnus glutinosa]
MRMSLQRNFWAVVLLFIGVVGANLYIVEGRPRPHRILLDTDVDTDDLFALLYLLKQNRSEFELEAVTINTNAWTDAGHAVNQIYDILYMMDRDDIAVGVGGEGGILEDGTILPNVGGYLPIIEQGTTTIGYCRYKQAIPLGQGGRLDIDANYGLRKAFLPQGRRKYAPLRQPAAQQVMIDKISAGPITIFVIGAHTNLAIFLMNNPHLRKNIKHIFVMGGGVRSKNPTGCCPQSASSSCVPHQCGDHGNLFTDYTSNPYAEFNVFGDPFAAYQSYFMWDSFTSGVATSIMRNSHNHDGENDFAEMEYMNITVVTSNKPYGVHDGSNPLFNGRVVPKFNLQKGGVHSGHVQTGLRDPFCLVKNGKGKCKDGYTAEVTGPEAVHVLVATKAKSNRDMNSPLNREFYKSFLDALNRPQNAGRFNFTTQFPHYKEILYKPDFGSKTLGKPVVFDMDMSAGDFLALFYLLKIPVEVINLKAIIVSPTGWVNAATIDVVYDLLHMMGRDDIPVGLGDMFAMNQSDPTFSAVGDCKYIKAIPHGSGGLIDSDTLYGLARTLPRSPRRYTAENSVKYGAPRDTDHPKLRQLLALEVWESVVETLEPGSKITILTNGPLTNLAKIILTKKNTTSLIQDVYIVGGHISRGHTDKGNVFSVPSNEYAEFNMFLDPLAAKTVFDSELDITLIPLGIQRRVGSFPRILERLQEIKTTPEAKFTHRLLSRLHRLQQMHIRYKHMDTFSGEILGAVVLAGDHSPLKPTLQVKPIRVFAEGVESNDGQTVIDEKHGKLIKILENVNPAAYYDLFASQLRDEKQSAVVGSFNDQRRMWNTPKI